TVEYVPATWANQADVRFAIWEGVPCHHPGREEVDEMATARTGRLHDPEIIQHVAGARARIRGTVQRAYLFANVSGQLREGPFDLLPVHRAERNAHGVHGNRIDVAPQGRESKLVRLHHRCARPHERIEHGEVREGVGAVKLCHEVCLLSKSTAQE